MGNSIFFAKAFSIYFLVVGIALFLNPARFRRWYEDILAEDRRALFGGTIALFIGCFVIAAHNRLVADWPLLITLIGYWGVFKGAGLLSIPGFVQVFRPMIGQNEMIYRASGVAWVLIGAFLFYQGFC